MNILSRLENGCCETLITPAQICVDYRIEKKRNTTKLYLLYSFQEVLQNKNTVNYFVL